MLKALFVAVALAIIIPIGAELRAQDTAPQSVEAEIVTAPVQIDGVELFRVRGVSSLPAAERARLMEQQIVAAADDPSVSPDALRIVDSEFATRIQAGDRVLVAVTDADARLEQVERQALAAGHLYRLKQAIEAYRNDRTPAAVRGEIARALIATLIFVAAVLLIRWLWRLGGRLVAGRLRGRIQRVGIQSFEVIKAERVWDAVHAVAVALRALILLALFLVFVGYVLSQFPWTRAVSRDMATFALEPIRELGRGLLYSIPKLMFLVVLFLAFRVVLRIVRLFFDAIDRGAVSLPKFQSEWAQPTYKIVRAVLVAFGVVVAYPYIPGSNSAAFQGVSLFIGIMFSLGSSSVISNIIAGYAMIYRRAFKVGDRIRIGQSVGDVTEMRLQVTHLRSIKNEELIVPNSQILNNDVMNYTSLAREHGLILHTEVGIGYETPWRQVESMLIEAAHRTEGLGTDPRPYVLVNKLGDFAVTYEINVYCTNVPVMGRLLAALHRNILDVFNENGVQIMTPAYESDPETPKIAPPPGWKPSRPDTTHETH